MNSKEQSTQPDLKRPLSHTAKPKSYKRWARRVIYALIASAVVAGVVVATRPKPLAIETVKVARGPLRVLIEEPGRTRVRDRVTVSAPLAGEMSRVELRAGDQVTRNTVLARLVPASAPLLDPRSRAEAAARAATADAATAQARSAVARAELAAQHAQADVEREKKLASTGSVTSDEAEHVAFEARLREEELASARFGVRRAAHEAEMARATLARHDDGKRAGETFEVPSPIDGNVLRVLNPNAGYVPPGTAILELGDPSALEVVVDVLTPDAVRIPPRAKVSLERWGGPAAIDAHVRLVEPSAVTKLSALGVEEQRVSVVIDLDSPRDRWSALGDGFRVEALITIWEQDNVVSAPMSAIFRRGPGWCVFVVDGDRARLRSIEIGQRGVRDVQIISGLNEGDTIVIHPSEQLVDGGLVAPRR